MSDSLEMIIWIIIQLSCSKHSGHSLILIFLQFFYPGEMLSNLISGSRQADSVSNTIVLFE